MPYHWQSGGWAAWVLPQLGDAISGSGLLVLLELCSTRVENWVAVGCAVVGFIAALVLKAASPLWLRAATLLFNLTVSLSVCLHVFASLCPPEGKEFALIPVYLLLCMSRPRIAVLSGVALGLMSLAFVTVFLGVVGLSPGVIDSQLGSDLSSSDETLSGCLWIFLAAAYGALPHMLPVYLSDYDSTPLPFDIPFEFVVAGGVCRLVVFAAVGLCKSALLSLFLAPTWSSLHSAQPNYLSAFFGICLLVACMHMSSAWFEQLKLLTAILSGRAYTARRLVRLQHVLIAGLVGAAWAFPLHLGVLRVVLVACLVLLQAAVRIYGAVGT
jgi:hypothetical protein